MIRKLTRLRIDEVSCVVKGAGTGTEVLLRKSVDGTSHRQLLQQMFATIPYSKLKIAPPNDPDDDLPDDDDEPDDDEAVLPGSMEQYVTALQTANPTLSREDAVAFLIHSARGVRVAEHMSSTFKRKEPTMTTCAGGLRDLAKQYGVSELPR
jgi:hypothetical protein